MAPLRVPLVLASLVLVIVVGSCASSSRQSPDGTVTNAAESHKPYVVFMSLHARGHWGIIHELAQRVAKLELYEIGFAMARERQQVVEQLQELGVSWVDAGSVPFTSDEEIALKAISFDPSSSPATRIELINQYFGRIGEAMVKQLKPTFERRKPDFLVCDMMTTACTDLAEYFSIPSMMLLTMPAESLGVARSEGRKTANVLVRALAPLGSLLLERAIRVVMRYRNDEVRHKLLNLPPVPSWVGSGVQYPKSVIIVGSSLAWEPAASYPPFLHFVGPLLPKSAASKIDDDLRAWLEQPRETHGHVVYVATGTNVELDQAQVDALARAIGRVADAGHRVLWSLRSAQQAILFHQSNANNDNEQVTSRASWRERVRVMEWVPQLEVLSHENTRVFLSHCGHNSLMEALMHGRAILAMPFGADQPANARLVEHHGVGLATSPRPISSDDVAQSLLRLLDDEQFTINARRLQKKLALEPGFNEAIRLLRVGVEAGNEHFTPAIFKEHWIHHNDVDLMVLSAVAVIVVYQVVSWCCGCLLCRGNKKSSTTSATKKQQQKLHHKAE